VKNKNIEEEIFSISSFFRIFKKNIDKNKIKIYSVIHNSKRGDNLNFIISNNSEIPIYQQIKKEIINSISNNELKENDMLPSIRNLAKDLRISILTVKKAYDELEQEAYIKTVQGKGTFVTPRNTELIREKQISIIEEHIEQIINIAKISNISKNEIIDLFNYLYEEE
jgi:GntR family transcriptional regulator